MVAYILADLLHGGQFLLPLATLDTAKAVFTDGISRIIDPGL
jgi:hypothetical protein